MSNIPLGNVFYFIEGVFNVIISNWLLSVPLALFIISMAFEILKKTMKMVKNGGK